MEQLNYENEYRRLNKKQQEAVNHIEGPVMVIAGPGTGKTQVIAMRIAQILKRTQLDPQNILTLTFTEAGVDAIRQRLTRIIGSAGYQVAVYTFHGFASDIIRLFGHKFAASNELRQISEIERFRLIEDIVGRDSSLTELRPPRAVCYHIASISRAIKTLKQEGVSPDKLKKLAQQELAASQSEISLAKKILFETKARRNLELSTIYDKFQVALESYGQYDYEDIISFVGAALSQDKEIRAFCQERYQYILVDEYQDTNASQNRLIEALADFFETPNLCVVGDDKQAIYRFQGASVANMLHFYNRYPDMHLVSLRENYRSTDPILLVAEKLIANNQQQLRNFLPTLGGVGLQSNRPGGNIPLLVELSSESDQLIWIISQIQKLNKDDIHGEDIAVICRTNAEVKIIAGALQEAQISISSKMMQSWRDEPVVKSFMGVLKAVDQPEDDRFFSVALRLLSPADGIKELVTLHDLLNHTRGRVADYAKSDKLPKLGKIIQQVLGWHQLALGVSLTDLLKEVAQSVLPVLTKKSSFVNAVESLSKLFSEAKILLDNSDGLTLSDWLSELDTAASYHLSDANTQQRFAGGVTVSTVHGVKGLEFEAVLMVNVSEEHWNDRALRSVISLPAEISGLKDWKDSSVEDERRLFYVGLTRAKQYLFLSYSKQRADGRVALPSQFIEETRSCLRGMTPRLSISSRQSASMRAVSIASPLTIRRDEQGYIRALIQSRPFSASDMIAYQACPRRYLLQKVLRFPNPPDFSLLYGDAIHRALELFFRKYQSSQRLPSKKILVGYFQTSLRNGLRPTDRQVALERGTLLLERYYDQYSTGWSAPIGIEYNFLSHHVELAGIWLTGKCDRVDLFDLTTKLVRVTDYKTGGRAKTLGEVEGTTKNSQGELMRQMLFYAVLMKNDSRFPYEPREFALAFLDDSLRFPVYPLVFSPKQIRKMETEIVEVWRAILADREFKHSESQTGQRSCELCALFP